MMNAYPNEHMVTLVDGRQVSNYSEEYRHECEARAVLDMPTLAQRRAYLYGTLNKWNKYAGGISQRRGQDALKRMEDTMMAIHRQRLAKRAANDNAALPLTSAHQA